jgi:mannose-6-phosphate isomerase-like protein (cupin superfamily)
MRRIAIVLGCAVLAAVAADAPVARVWKAAELHQLPTTLAPKVDPRGHMAMMKLADVGASAVSFALREASGGAELHETQADVIVAQAGEATLITGGTIVDAKTTQPHEVRGSAITGGTETELAPGDFVIIPAGTPHQMKLAAGKQFAYLVMKVGQ